MHITEPDYFTLDQEVARHIIGMPEGLLNDPHFPLPHYSTNRNDASMLLDKLLAMGREVTQRFDEALLAMEGGWLRDAPLHQQLFGITPDMICRAGLAAVNPGSAGPESP